MTDQQQQTLWDRWAPNFDRWQATANPAGEDEASFLLELVPAGEVLELAVGTGRVALELARRGRRVTGVDISPEMIERLNAKRGNLPVSAMVGDMSEPVAEGEFHLIYLVASSFFCITSQERQVRCFQSAARSLAAEGAFVLQAYVPHMDMVRPGGNIALREMSHERVRISATHVDTAAQLISFQEITITENGIELLPVEERYCWPAELDLMAQLAGLRLVERYATFARAPFDKRSVKHVSVYRHVGKG